MNSKKCQQDFFNVYFCGDLLKGFKWILIKVMYIHIIHTSYTNFVYSLLNQNLIKNLVFKVDLKNWDWVLSY